MNSIFARDVVISVLSAVIVSGMDFWIYSSPTDRLYVGFGLAVVMLGGIMYVEELLRIRRIKKFWTERFRRMVNEMQNGSLQAGEQERSVS